MRNTQTGPISPYTTAVCLGLLLLVGATPWFFGGVWASVQAPLLLATAGLLVVDLVGQLRTDRGRAVLPAALVPLALGIALGLAQLVPLPEPLRQRLAPTATQLRADLLDDALQSFDPELEPPSTRSIYPPATRQQLALLILGTSVYYLAARHFQSRRAWGWLVRMTSLLGGALALFAIVQQLTWNGMLYWRVPLTKGPGNPFGPYVNHNNAGGFLNLTLSGAVAWLIWMTWSKDHGHRAAAWPDETAPGAATAVPVLHGGPHAARGQAGMAHLAAFAARLDASGMALLGLIGLLAAAVVMTLSRGSMLAMLAAGGVSIALLALRPGNRRYALPMLLALAGAVFVITWVGEAHTVRQRMESLLEEDLGESELRLRNWPDALKAAAFYIGWGSGLGTYPYAYTSLQDWHWNRQFVYAENQYLQALVEMGVAGLGLLLVAILLTVRAVAYLYRHDRGAGPALAIAGAFALTSQVVGGSLDFGLYIPANMLLMALWCGAVTGRALHVAQRQGRPAAGIGWRLSPASGPLVPLLLLVGATAGWLELRRAAHVESALAAAPLERIRQEHDPDQWERRRALWRRAAAARPDDYRVHQHLAEIDIQQARMVAFQRLRQEHPEASDEQLWDRTQPFELHRTVRQLERLPEGRPQLEALRAALGPSIRPAWHALLLARHCCPLVAHLHLQLAENCLLAAPGSDDRLHIARARALAPGDAEIWFWSGVLDWNSGRTDQAVQAWRRSLELSPQYEEDILRLARRDFSAEWLLDHLLRPEVQQLLRVARRDFAAPEDQVARTTILDRADRCMQNQPRHTPEDLYRWGAVLELLGRPEQALERYGQAVRQNPTELRWRYDYARLLLEQGEVAEAYAQARYGVAAGGGGRFQKLLNRIRRQMPSVK